MRERALPIRTSPVTAEPLKSQGLGSVGLMSALLQRSAATLDPLYQVKHVIVCGHYGCDPMRASSDAGLGDPWLRHAGPVSATTAEMLTSRQQTECLAFCTRDILVRRLWSCVMDASWS